jgi:hypothetical protein
VDLILGSTFEEEKKITESVGDAADSGIPHVTAVLAFSEDGTASFQRDE